MRRLRSLLTAAASANRRPHATVPLTVPHKGLTPLLDARRETPRAAAGTIPPATAHVTAAGFGAARHVVRHTARRAMAGLLSLALALGGPVSASAQVRLPSLGESSSDDLPASVERRIGDTIMREGRRDPVYFDDPVLLAYVQSLWTPLLDAARRSGDIGPETDDTFAWEIFLVLDRSVNAFAMPGGYVGIHLGLINMTQNRDQLVSVMAHELAHVTQRHIARSIAASKRSALVSVASVLLAVIAASRAGGADAANAALMTGQAAAIQGQLNFSREMEREADRIGFGLMDKAGFATIGVAQMFERMDQATRLSDGGGFPYLRSHPLTIDRMTEARNRAMMNASGEPAPPLLHAVMQARARVLMDPTTAALQRLSGGTSSPDLADQVGARYAGALAQARLGDMDRSLTLADEALALATQAAPREPATEQVLRLLQAEVALAAGRVEQAQQALAGLPAPRSADDTQLTARPTLLLRTQTTLAAHRAGLLPTAAGAAEIDPADPVALARAAAQDPLRRNAEALQIWLADHPQDPLAWEALSATADAAGLRLRSLRASAEARAAVGDLPGAIDRLRAAQGIARSPTGQDFIEASVIDARMRQLVAERRALELEARGGRAPGEATRPPPELGATR